jgi:hypothetical protein
MSCGPGKLGAGESCAPTTGGDSEWASTVAAEKSRAQRSTRSGVLLGALRVGSWLAGVRDIRCRRGG